MLMGRSRHGKALERSLVEFKAEAGRGWHPELAFHGTWNFLEEPPEPRHVFDGESVRDRTDQMHMHFRYEVTDHRQLEGLCHPGALEPLRDAADPHEIDHHDVDRARLQHVAEGRNAPEALAPGDRGRQ